MLFTVKQKMQVFLANPHPWQQCCLPSNCRCPKESQFWVWYNKPEWITLEYIECLECPSWDVAETHPPL